MRGEEEGFKAIVLERSRHRAAEKEELHADLCTKLA
jgi:hypothetical protein